MISIINDEARATCGCLIEVNGDATLTLTHCPLHAAAEEMRKFVANVAAYSLREVYEDPAIWNELHAEARAMLATVK